MQSVERDCDFAVALAYLLDVLGTEYDMEGQ